MVRHKTLWVMLIGILAMSACNVTTQSDENTPIPSTATQSVTQTVSASQSPGASATPNATATTRSQPTAAPPPTTANTSTTTCTDDLDFVSDVNVPDGTEIVPGSQLSKTWRVRNSGTCTWNSNYRFVQIDTRGNFITSDANGVVPATTAPGQTTDISVIFGLSPETPFGTTERARFQMRDPSGNFFGQTPYVEVISANDGADVDDCENDLDFVSDVNIPDGTTIVRGNTFTKTWRVRNSGTCAWQADYRFVQIEGTTLSANPSEISVPLLSPGGETDLSVTLTLSSTAQIGETYRVKFQLQDGDDNFFGQTPFVDVVAGS